MPAKPPAGYWEASIRTLPHIGPARVKAFAESGIETIGDLVTTFPRRYLDRSTIVPLANAVPDKQGTFIGKVVSAGYKPTRKGKRIFTLHVYDGTGYIECTWFVSWPGLDKLFHEGDLIAVSGRVSFFRGLQMVHPDWELLDNEDERGLHTGRVIPIYPLTQQLRRVGLTARGMRELLWRTLELATEKLPEWIPADILRKSGLPQADEALHSIHFPKDLPEAYRARARFAFGELFIVQMAALEQRRERDQVVKGRVLAEKAPRTRQFIDSLPFRMTGAQVRVVGELFHLLRRPAPMDALLQGDVGSGKTLVAAVGLHLVVENGYQGLLMAPTELLAEQHARNLTRILAPHGVQVAFLSGSVKPAERRDILYGLLTGAIHVLVATHAVLTEDVVFRCLGLAVIDEQHRFGVAQRGAILAKGTYPDILVMTATPIPRTLAMTVYGDLSILVLDELPPGRSPIATHVVEEIERGRVYRWVRKEIEAGRQAYVVLPAIEESATAELRAAKKVFKELSEDDLKGIEMRLLTGKMKREEQEAVMAEFIANRAKVLIATTVIEVGVDVANSTVMVIEQGERFGLSQLHQLRGRVGRGAAQSTCWCIVSAKAADESRERLQAFADTLDGFRIAEEDLRLRGPGEFFGSRQTGLPHFKVANLVLDRVWLERAREHAERIMAEDPDLAYAVHQGIAERVVGFRESRRLFADVV